MPEVEIHIRRKLDHRQPRCPPIQPMTDQVERGDKGCHMYKTAAYLLLPIEINMHVQNLQSNFLEIYNSIYMYLLKALCSAAGFQFLNVDLVPLH